nr:MAG TPA: hypothetical protein [Caudoviricetes sp.]
MICGNFLLFSKIVLTFVVSYIFNGNSVLRQHFSENIDC